MGSFPRTGTRSSGGTNKARRGVAGYGRLGVARYGRAGQGNPSGAALSSSLAERDMEFVDCAKRVAFGRLFLFAGGDLRCGVWTTGLGGRRSSRPSER